MTTLEILKSAKTAVKTILTLSTEQKNEALLAMADALVENTDFILSENALDIEAARGKISDVMIDRLCLTADRIKGMADGIRDVVRLPDPVGEVLETVTRPNGLVIKKTVVPMGH